MLLQMEQYMNIIIIEKEIYLAQSIAAKLADLGHTCDIYTSSKDTEKQTKYDVVFSQQILILKRLILSLSSINRVLSF